MQSGATLTADSVPAHLEVGLFGSLQKNLLAHWLAIRSGRCVNCWHGNGPIGLLVSPQETIRSMQLFVPCMQCLHGPQGPRRELARVAFRDDGTYVLTCSRGHESITLLQQQKFEVLFEIGANAILDGYHREAVSAFSASLERFHEFAIRVLLADVTGSDDLFKSCWGSVAAQSERQLGAFVFIWASRIGAPPSLLSQKRVAYRNEVIHKGKIPSGLEAVKFGNAALDVLRSNMKHLERFEHGRNKIAMSDQVSIQAKTGLIGTTYIKTILSFGAVSSGQAPGDLQHHLAELSMQREVIKAVGKSGVLYVDAQ